LGVIEDSAKLFGTESSLADCLSLALLLLLLLGGLRSISHIGRNSVDEILDCALDVVEGCPQGLDALFSGETHRHQFCDFCLIGLLLGGFLGWLWFRCFLLLFLRCLFLLLFVFLLLGGFGFGFFSGLGGGFLGGWSVTATCAMTTMKSVSLMASFSIVSSLATVLPLKTILSVSAGSPFASWILALRFWTCVGG